MTILFVSIVCSYANVELGSCQEFKWARSVLPIPMTGFKSLQRSRTSESELDFPRQVAAPEGATKTRLILADNEGFAAPTAFGGPVPT